MQISEEQIKEYIEIQKKDRGVTLSLEEAYKEASELLMFVNVIYKRLPQLQKNDTISQDHLHNKQKAGMFGVTDQNSY